MAKQRSKIEGLMGDKAKTNTTKTINTIKTTKTTILLDEDDEAEIDRIQDLLRARGLRVNENTKIIRLALRAAFRDLESSELEEVHTTLAEKWKRGGNGS